MKWSAVTKNNKYFHTQNNLEEHNNITHGIKELSKKEIIQQYDVYNGILTNLLY